MEMETNEVYFLKSLPQKENSFKCTMLSHSPRLSKQCSDPVPSSAVIQWSSKQCTAWISTLLFTLRSKQWYSAKEYCTVMTLKSWFILLSHTHSTFYTQHPIINTETQHFTVATFKIWLTCFSHVKKNPLCWQCKMLSRD